MLNYIENMNFEGKLEFSPFLLQQEDTTKNKSHLFSEIGYGEDKYQLQFCIYPLSKAFPLVISSHLPPILPMILHRKTTKWSI